LLGKFYPGVQTGAAETVRGIRTDGQKTYHVITEPLTPSMTGSIVSSGEDDAAVQRNLDALRQRLQAALNPKHFGDLIYNNYAGSYRLHCRPITGAQIGDRIGNVLPIDIEWISDNPNWTATNPNSISVGIQKKSWRFPWIIKPTVFAEIITKGVIFNPTMIDIFPKIIISATQSSSVTVGNSTTGEYTTISHTISETQRLEIDMSIPSIVLIDDTGAREDVTHWTTADSVFPWVCVPGTNDIYCAVDNPMLSPIITLIWYQPIGGL